MRDSYGTESGEGEEELASYWMDYVMRVPCEQPRATKSDTLDVLSGLERQLRAGEITPAEFVDAKSSLSKQFFGSVMEVEKLPRAISMLSVQVQVTRRVKFSMTIFSLLSIKKV